MYVFNVECMNERATIASSRDVKTVSITSVKSSRSSDNHSLSYLDNEGMEYQVPKGFEDFISSAETLLGQYASTSSSALDTVVYTIYTLQDSSNTQQRKGLVPSLKNLQYLQQLCAEINAFASTIFKGYIWHHDPFRLYVIKVRECK